MPHHILDQLFLMAAGEIWQVPNMGKNIEFPCWKNLPHSISPLSPSCQDQYSNYICPPIFSALPEILPGLGSLDPPTLTECHTLPHIATHCNTLPHIAHPHRVSHGIASAGNPEILTLGHQTNGAVSRSAQLSILVPGITPKLVSWLRAIRWARIPEACQPTSSPKIQNRG